MRQPQHLSSQLINIVECHANKLTCDTVQKLQTSPRTPSYNSLAYSELIYRVNEIYQNLSHWLCDKTDPVIRSWYNELGEKRFKEGHTYTGAPLGPHPNETSIDVLSGLMRARRFGDRTLSATRARSVHRPLFRTSHLLRRRRLCACGRPSRKTRREESERGGMNPCLNSKSFSSVNVQVRILPLHSVWRPGMWIVSSRIRIRKPASFSSITRFGW